MVEKSKKRPRDANQLGKFIVDVATDQQQADDAPSTKKSESSRGKEKNQSEQND